MSDQLSVVILDDEALARERMFRLVEALPGYSVAAVFSDGLDAITQIELLKPDLALLDISMPGISGIEVAKHISTFEHAPAIVFCTAFDEYAVQAFDAGAVGYLMKPVRPEKLLKALGSASRLNKLQLSQISEQTNASLTEDSDQECLRVKSQRGIQIIPMSEVICFVADGKYVTAKHRGGDTLIEVSLTALEDKHSDLFTRCHRSDPVRIGAISGLDRTPDGSHCLSLSDQNYTLPVSRRHLADIRGILLGIDE
jgi:two-component system response regulator AlgR